MKCFLSIGIFLLASLAPLFTCAEELLDVETPTRMRTTQYRIEPWKKIVVFSAPRTGSSLLYNILRFLFEKDQNLWRRHDQFYRGCTVVKTHKYADASAVERGDTFFVVPIRNPLHASMSTYRIHYRPIEVLQDFCKNLITRQADHLMFETLQMKGQKVVFLRYEDFEDHPDYVMDFIEDQFQIAISPRDRDLIRRGYSRENIFFSVQALRDFGELLPISGFHGKHVSLENYTIPDEAMFWLNFYLEGAKPLYRKYGYFGDVDPAYSK